MCLCCMFLHIGVECAARCPFFFGMYVVNLTHLLPGDEEQGKEERTLDSGTVW